jgi:hypothetical protein
VAIGTGERLYVNVGSNGHGTVLTRVAVFRPDGKARGVRLVPAWSLPAAVPGQAEDLVGRLARRRRVDRGSRALHGAVDRRSSRGAPDRRRAVATCTTGCRSTAAGCS